MCGIAGWIGRERGGGGRVEAALAAMANRGPDGRGWIAWSPTGEEPRRGVDIEAQDGEVVLGHLRLSIIDLSDGGRQPMSSADGRWHLTYNGELYNYVELRRELEAQGHGFRTASDTEVLLAAWEVWGAQCLPRLIGMFAFAVLDTHAQTVTLVRDPFGIKPLCYASDSGGTFFASDVPGVMASGSVPRRIDLQSMHDFLRWGRVDHTNRTMVQGVRSLPAGHMLVVSAISGAASTPEPYWALPAGPRCRDDSIERSAAELREEFLTSLRLHVRSDVPVGCLLSGGVDSSAILAGMRHVLGDQADLHAFSYVSDDPLYDEEHWVDLVAAGAGATVHKVRLEVDSMFDSLDDVILAQGEPFPSMSILAQHQVFSAAKDADITVLLDGQGADELFGGYRRHVAAQFTHLVRTGRLLRAARLAAAVTHRPDVILERATLRRLAEGLVPPAFRRARDRQGWVDAAWYAHCGVETGSRDDAARVDDSLRDAFLRSTLPSLLRYEDRNSMAWSRESRVPFLTPGMVDLAFRLPSHHLVAGDGTTKVAFRAAMRGLVPDPVLERRDKVGFDTPRWWHDELLLRGSAMLDDLGAERLGIVPDALRRMSSGSGQAGKTALWRVINAQRWAKLFEMEP